MTQTLHDRPSNGIHSAAVRIELHVDGVILHPTHTASDWIKIEKPQFIRPGEADLIIFIDGVPHQSRIRVLPQTSATTRIPVQILRKFSEKPE